MPKKRLTKEQLLKRIEKIQKEIDSKHSQRSHWIKRLAEDFGIRLRFLRKKRARTLQTVSIAFTNAEIKALAEKKGNIPLRQYIKMIIHKHLI